MPQVPVAINQGALALASFTTSRKRSSSKAVPRQHVGRSARRHRKNSKPVLRILEPELRSRQCAQSLVDLGVDSSVPQHCRSRNIFAFPRGMHMATNTMRSTSSVLTPFSFVAHAPSLQSSIQPSCFSRNAGYDAIPIWITSALSRKSDAMSAEADAREILMIRQVCLRQHPWTD